MKDRTNRDQALRKEENVVTAAVANQFPRSHPTPLFGEVRMLAEMSFLPLQDLLFGWTIPRGNEVVVPVPGYLSGDLFLASFRGWLRKLGHRVESSGIDVNRSCLEPLVDTLTQTVDVAFRKYGEKVTVIGHSLGGAIGLLAARRTPHVKQVIALGSPLSTDLRVSDVLRLALEVDKMTDRKLPADCRTLTDKCPIGIAIRNGLVDSVVPLITISSVFDGAVHWEDTMHRDPSRRYYIAGTHSAMPYNWEVRRIVGRLLAT